MKRPLILIALFLSLAAVTPAQESVTLTVPVVKTSTATYALDTLLLDVTQGRIVVTLKANNGDTFTKQYDNTTPVTGATLLSSLNTSNNSGANPSMIKKVYNRLIADGVILGTVAGTPQ